jgi:excisionase family DNA binding protein
MQQFMEPAMTVRDVAAILNVDEKTIYRLAQRGDLPGFKVSGSWRFQRSDLEAWIAERKGQALTGKPN